MSAHTHRGWAYTPTASQHIFNSGKTLAIFVCAPDGIRTAVLWTLSPTFYPLSHPVTLCVPVWFRCRCWEGVTCWLPRLTACSACLNAATPSWTGFVTSCLMGRKFSLNASLHKWEKWKKMVFLVDTLTACWKFEGCIFNLSFIHFSIPFGKFRLPDQEMLQQPHEQRYPVLQVHAGSFHISVIHQTLDMDYRIFNMCTCVRDHSYACVCNTHVLGTAIMSQHNIFDSEKRERKILVLLT